MIEVLPVVNVRTFSAPSPPAWQHRGQGDAGQ
jgi:hypothetical protein